MLETVYIDPGFYFVNTLMKPEERNVCIKQQDMWGSLLEIFFVIQVYIYTGVSKNVVGRKAKSLRQDRKVIWDFYNDQLQVL